MKRRHTFLLFIIFSLIPLPFLSGIFNKSQGGFSAIWDALSFQIVYISAILLFFMTFIRTKKSSKDFFIYKLIWLQEMFIISGLSGTMFGFVLTLNAMEMEMTPGVDPIAVLISNLAISMITIVYGFMGAVTVYLIQKYHEMNIDKKNENIVEKPKEGFLFSSLIYFLIVVVFTGLAIYIGSGYFGGVRILASPGSLIYIVTILIIFIFFYKGNSIINLIKNLFWYIPDQVKNIEYNLKYIRDMKKILAMIISVSFLCAPIVMLVALTMPTEENIFGWNSNIFIGLKNGGLQFMWVLDFIFLLNIIEGREVSKLYFETGKISAGDRFYSIKYILAPSFLLFITFSFGIMLSFIL